MIMVSIILFSMCVILFSVSKKRNLRKVVNKDKHMNADKVYWYSKPFGGKGYLFTDSQLYTAQKRYEKNKEDVK